MKTRLNIFCLFLILSLSYSVLQMGYYFIAGANAGLQSALAGQQNTEASLSQDSSAMDSPAATRIMNMKTVNMMPNLMDHAHLMQDSVFNEKTGEYVPALYTLMAVSVQSETPLWQFIVQTIASFAMVGFYIWAIYLFIRLIIAVNKGDIFVWHNVRRLRRLGIALILCYVCTLAIYYLGYSDVAQVFSNSQYSYSLMQATEVTTLVLGLISLLIAEVFAIGLKMKEEQDLTI